jgi:uncharacterized phage-like protein YoqJ
MNLIVTGHRDHKLETYDKVWIKGALDETITTLRDVYGASLAYSGMASGVDLMFCESCQFYGIPFIACVPFDGQELTMTDEDRRFRNDLLKIVKEVKHVKNSWMVEHCDLAIAVWDGNKGGTHNVVQQLVEKKKNFYWINPVSKVVWKCFSI